VLQILARDPRGRPSQILMLALEGSFDSSMQGWRAMGHAGTFTVGWSADGTASIG
jgi:hypothetical protein